MARVLRRDIDALTAFTEAARSYRRSAHHDRAVEVFEMEVIPTLLENGKLGLAAKVCWEDLEVPLSF